MTAILSRKTMVILPLVLFALQVYWGSQHNSLTWDEPSYIASGYNYLTTYDFSFNPSHPPLAKAIVALPLLFLDIRTTTPNEQERTSQVNPQAEYGYRFIYGNNNDPRKIAYWCRLPAILMGMCLVLAVYSWGREIYGGKAALLGALLAALCPNLIAQSGLATEDIGCALLMFISVWLYWRCLNRPTWGCASLCGVVTGLALLAKYTSLLLGIIYILLAVVKIWREDRADNRIKTQARYILAICFIAILVVSAAYNFNPYHYFAGIGQIYSDMKDSVNWHFFGVISNEPRWYYYIVLFFVKTPLPTLICIILAFALSVADCRYRKDMAILLLPVLVIVCATCIDKGNWGMRRILPALPFLYLFAARVVIMEKRKLVVTLTAALLAWLTVEAVCIYPHHYSYFNNAVGGPENAPFVLTADASDIGQDLPALADWQKNHPEAGTLKLFYNGTTPPAAYGVRFSNISTRELDHPTSGTYAVSITELVFTPWFGHVEPVARAGYSIYIYKF